MPRHVLSNTYTCIKIRTVNPNKREDVHSAVCMRVRVYACACTRRSATDPNTQTHTRAPTITPSRQRRREEREEWRKGEQRWCVFHGHNEKQIKNFHRGRPRATRNDWRMKPSLEFSVRSTCRSLGTPRKCRVQQGGRNYWVGIGRFYDVHRRCRSRRRREWRI